MKELARSIKVFEESGDGRVVVPLIEQPLLRFSDAARNHPDGTLWAWGEKGRPRVLLELYLANRLGTLVWSHALHSLANRPLVAEGIEESSWTPPAAEPEMTHIPDAPAAASSKPVRLGQMKALARRFKVHQFWEGKRSNLRMLARPVRRYEDPASGIMDGAMFVFVHGTNPELVLLVELFAHDTRKPEWQYGIVRQGHAEFHIHCDGKEVWQCDKLRSRNAKNPFWYYAVPASDPLEFSSKSKGSP